MQFYGTVVDKNLAIQMATNSGFNKIVKENNKALQDGSASTKQALETRKRHSKEEMDQAINLSGTIGKASNAVGAYTEVSQAMSESMTGTQRIINADINKASKDIQTQMEQAAKPTDKADPTALLLEAVEKGAVAAKMLQEKVIDKLPMLSAAMTKAFDDAIAALDGRGGGGPGGIMAKLLEYLPLITAGLTALTLAMQLMPGKMTGIFQNIKDKIFKPKMPGSTGFDAIFDDGPGKGGGKFANMMSKMGKMGSMLVTGAKFLGPIAAIAGAGYSGFQGYQNTAANFDLKEGQEATTGQKVSSTLAGALSGLSFGLIDEKQLAQGLQNLNLKAQEMWSNMSAGIAKKWEDVSSWAKKSTNEFLAAHPKLAEVIGKFPKSFDEAGKLAKNLLSDTQAKFKSEFPKLYANLESTFKTVGNFTSGLMDSVSNKWNEAKSYLAQKLGWKDQQQPATANVARPAAPTTTSTTPAATTFNETDKKNIQSWANGVSAGQYTLAQVPAVYRDEVSKLIKSKPTAGTPTTAQPGTSTPPRVALGSLPAKQGLTAAEKAAAMETVAVNTKYTNDLLIASQRNVEQLQKLMLQRLEAIVSATEAAAGYGKKTARNTS
jgi:hypothetical protein